MTTVLNIERSDNFKDLRKQIEARWLELETMPSTFRYKLNIQKQKIISNGPFKVLIQVFMNEIFLYNAQIFPAMV